MDKIDGKRNVILYKFVAVNLVNYYEYSQPHIIKKKKGINKSKGNVHNSNMLNSDSNVNILQCCNNNNCKINNDKNTVNNKINYINNIDINNNDNTGV